MKVKTIKPHGNGHGDKFEKTQGTVYEVPENAVSTLVLSGLVEKVPDGDVKPVKALWKPPAKKIAPAKPNNALAPATGDDKGTGGNGEDV